MPPVSLRCPSCDASFPADGAPPRGEWSCPESARLVPLPPAGEEPAPPPTPLPDLRAGEPPAAGRIRSWWGRVVLHVRRAFAWDLGRLPVRPDEQRLLAGRGVTDAQFQRYLAWRRSVLLIVCAPVALL